VSSIHVEVPLLRVCYVRGEDAMVSRIKSVMKQKMITENTFPCTDDDDFRIGGSTVPCCTPRGDISSTNKVGIQSVRTLDTS
jgi:hypothetical protein